jgi:serine/threonine protein kinase
MTEGRIPIDDVFHVARRISDPVARGAYLEQACGGDRDLRARVEALLGAHDGAGSFLQSPAGAGFAAALDLAALPPGYGPGSGIGPYKLLQQIGEGGMGVVYMAEQQHPVRRKVALKVIKPGFDTRQVIARFEAERQALALMDHENIAKVLDAGATESGLPYFVMELVHGVHITEFCDRNRLPPRQRLALFLQVCRAVQHAHMKGVIHRDIKPTNVLVTLREGVPVPKVIDFGIAKATGQQLTEKTLFTRFAQMVGTPLYMSPEQAEMTGIDVDTRSDIYSLGVLLYELLTGTTPVDQVRFKQAAFDEVLRIIREEEPPRPSTRLSTMDEQERSISAARRRSDPQRLGHLVRGDLDWIVMKALEKDRSRRYETANGLAMDLERYLADEAVLARPPSPLYRLTKLVRRHRGLFAAAAAVLLTLAGGIVGTTLGLVRAERARHAEADRAEGERRAKERAEASLDLARASVEKYLGTVTDDPKLVRDDFHQLRKRLLESAVPFFEQLAAQEGDDPAVEAGRGDAYLRLATLRMELGEYEAARKDCEAMRAIFTRLAADFPGEYAYRHGLALSRHNLASALCNLGNHEAAAALFREAIATYEDLIAEFPDNRADRHAVAACENSLGVLLSDIGKHEAAEAAYARSMNIQKELAAEFPTQPGYRQGLAGALHNLGISWANLGKCEKAEAALREALMLDEKLVAELPGEPGYRLDLAQQYGTLGSLLLDCGRAADADAAYREAVEITGKLAAEFPTVPEYRNALGKALCNQGIVLSRLGTYGEAEAAFRHALDIQRKLAAEFPAAPEYRAVLASIQFNLGSVLLDLGRRGEAEAPLREGLALKEALATDFPAALEYFDDLAAGYCNLGSLTLESGRPEAALGWFGKAIARLEPMFAREPLRVEPRQFLHNAYRGKAAALDELDRGEEALAALEEAFALLGPDDPAACDEAYDLIDSCDALGRYADALRFRERLLAMQREKLGPDDPETLAAMAGVADGYAELGRDADALKLHEQTLALMKARIPDHHYTLFATGALAGDLVRLGRGTEAIPLIDDCLRRAEGDADSSDLVRNLLGIRLRHFQGIKDPAGCRATAEMWERVATDAGSLYDAACCRAVTASVLRASGGEVAATSAMAEADRAMDLLTRALAAGFDNLAHMEQDGDLDALRDREDFRKLIAPRRGD